MRNGPMLENSIFVEAIFIVCLVVIVIVGIT
jgi:hypothetical protein